MEGPVDGRADDAQAGSGTVAAFVGVRLARGGRVLVEDADWRLPPGAFHLLTGSTGAGKSAFIAAAALRLRPEAGRVHLFGAPPDPGPEARAALRGRLGWAGQTPEFLAHMTLLDNVALPLRLGGLGPETRARQARELLDWIGLGPRAGDPPARLSAGERRLAGLARAVVAAPELILADEPAADLDAETAARALEMLAALAAHGTAVLAATQSEAFVRLARHRADARVLRLEDRRLRGAEGA